MSSKVSLQPLDKIQFRNANFFLLFDQDYAPEKKLGPIFLAFLGEFYDFNFFSNFVLIQGYSGIRYEKWHKHNLNLTIRKYLVKTPPKNVQPPSHNKVSAMLKTSFFRLLFFVDAHFIQKI